MTVYLRFTTTDDVYTVAESTKNPPTIVLTPHNHEGKRQLVRPDIMERMMNAGAVVVWDDDGTNHKSGWPAGHCPPQVQTGDTNG